MALHATLVFVFGLLGNIISFFVCLAPIPTFYQIYQRRTSEEFQSIPYIISLLSATLWLFYAIFKKDATLLITINSFTTFMEIAYIGIYLFYATRNNKTATLKLVLLFNVFGFGAICAVALFLLQGNKRVQVLGWICMIFALSVFVAPLCIVGRVIRTGSVEFMPFSLSCFLTLSAVMWFLYGYLKNDHFVAIPNVLGFIFGILQMLLYVKYRNPNKVMEEPNNENNVQVVPEHIVDVNNLSATIQMANFMVPVEENVVNESNGASIGQEQKKEKNMDISFVKVN